MGQFVMPSLGADMEAGTLIEWLKSPGDTVVRGDIIAAVETQKGAIEIEVFEDGTLDSTFVEIGDKLPVGTPMALILAEGEDAPAPKDDVAPQLRAETTPVKAEVTPAAKPPTRRKTDRERLRISPAARRMAEKAGIDLRVLAGAGTGRGGAVTLSDVEAHVGKPGKSAPATGMRAAIAAAMSRSKKEIPHYYLSHVVDLANSGAFVTSENETRPPEERLLLGALFLKAVAKALHKYPEFNGHFTDGVFVPSEVVHTGMAFSIRGGGLVAPAIRDAESHDLNALMSAMRDLANRVRAGRFRATELSGATITVSSLGERGVEQLYGVIYPPQVAIVGFGSPSERAIVIDGKVVPRLAATVTLAADHRVSDGHRGALFLRAIDRNLQDPEAL